MRTTSLFVGIIFSVLFVFNGSLELFAGDINARLDSQDGASKFSVQDSSESEVAYIDSDGNAYFEGNITAAVPTSDAQVATKGYVDAASGGSGPIWLGYTSSSTLRPSSGNGTYTFSGIKGMNAKCDSNYAGSHACTYDEIIRLGSSYPYSRNAWVIDGTVYLSTTKMGSKDGYSLEEFTSETKINCGGWTSHDTSSYGAIIYANSSYLNIVNCSNYYSIPCCE